MRVVHLACLAALATATPLSAQGTKLRLSGPTMWIRMDTVSAWVDVAGTTQVLFRSLLAAYKSVKLKTDLVDSIAGQLGNVGFNHTGAFAGRRMSTLVRCGQGLTGPNADTWRISIAVLSSVERLTEDSTRVRTITVASARNLAEGSSMPTMCASTGSLETLLNERAQALARGEEVPKKPDD